MEELKRKRGGYRARVTLCHDEFMKEWDNAKNLEVLKCQYDFLTVIGEGLAKVDEEILTLMTDADVDEEDLRKEIGDQYSWMLKVNICMNRYKDLVKEKPVDYEVQNAPVEKKEKRFKLPKVELRKFSGELTDWISWWSQFKEIHEDKEMKNTEKFFHLVQNTVPGSAARKLVDSFPQSEENYPIVIDRLRERFGREDLLTEHYVRDFISLIVKGVNSKEKDSVCLSSLYDEIIAKDRAMEALKMKSKKYLDVLLRALVESCLPRDVLLAWQRKEKTAGNFKELLEFMNEEVMNEQKRKLADQKFGFSSSTSEKVKPKSEKVHEKASKSKLPTAAGLVSQGQRPQECCFCAESHPSQQCKKAHSISFDERKKIVMSKKLCFSCLRKGHRVSDCKVKVKCSICNKRHETVICEQLGTNTDKLPKQEKAEPRKEESSQALANSASVSHEGIYLQTLVLKLEGLNSTRVVRALLDSGAERSCITEKAATELGFHEQGKVELNHTLFGGSETGVRLHKKYRVYVRSLTSSYGANFECMDEPRICGKIPMLRVHEISSDLKGKGIMIPTVKNAPQEIDLLIGSDIYGKLLTGQVLQLDSGLTAIETKLGWTVCGKMPQNGASNSGIAATVTASMLSCATVEDLWNLESIGIKDPAESKTRTELHEEAMKFFQKTVMQGNDGRYQVKLPWTVSPDALPRNETIAMKRLVSTSNKLKTMKIWKDYDNVFHEWEEAGIIEQVPSNELMAPSHYIPHRAVVKTSSATTKIRPVFDASCRATGFMSLNDCLEKGENLLELIPSVMHRFREKKIAIVSDIRKAFLQIGVHEDDRNFLRFLWWEDETQSKVKVYRHCRVVFGVTSSPFLLGAVIQHHLLTVEKDAKELCHKLWRSFYVDNCVTSVSDESELVQFHEFSVDVMKRAGMELVEWHHSLELGGKTGEDGQGETVVGVLGLEWIKERDSLSVKWVADELPGRITKRVLLSAIQRIFDPLGIVAPVTVCPKLMLQQAWKLKVSWDEDLPEDMNKKFVTWFMKMKSAPRIEVPRRVACCNREDGDWSLHVFCDASQDAYAAAVFLRSVNEHEVKVELVMAKSRVSPIKKVLIHRLELLACVIGVRLKNLVNEALDFHGSVHYWTDSAVSLAWIRRSDNWGVFVGNRVREIHESSDAKDWNHVPGVMNPADLPSRGCNAEQLIESRWWEGPSWLRQPEDCWPNSNELPDEEEVAAEKRKCIVAAMATSVMKWHENMSSFDKVVRIVAYMMRWKEINRKTFGDYISAQEFHEAEKKVIFLIQDESSKDIELLKKNLKLIKDKGGLLRIVSKLGERDDTEDFKLPILLPGKHRLVSLMLKKVHEENSHAGVLTCMRLVRERFWITKCRQVLKKVISACPGCRVFIAKKYMEETAMLPKTRVQSAAVFQTIGVDLAGPLFMKNGKKVWVVVFTCAVYRAVHMELVPAISTEAFLFAFRRFVARRRRPDVIYSDQGTNFVGMVNMLKNVDWRRVKNVHEAEKITWILNPPAAPWWGGFWERMVRVLKGLLIRILGKRSVDYEELATILVEIEDIINSRPLTYMSEEPGELLPLTPNSFMKDVVSRGLPDLKELCASDLRGRYRYQQKLLEEFRSRFRSEYLGVLKQLANDKGKRVAKVGDLVLIGHEAKKRIFWPMGVIVELIAGRDGRNRVAKVKTSSGVFERPVQKLYCLESELQVPDVHEIDQIEEPIDEEPAQAEEPELVEHSEGDVANVTTRLGRVVRRPDRFVP